MPRLENEGFQTLHCNSLALQFQWTTCWTTASHFFVYHYMGQSCSWTIEFTIACSSITVGLCFERWFPASPFTDACSHAVLPGGMSRFSRKPPRELLWKTDSKGPLIGLKKHLTESVSGILLDQSGEVVRLLELTIFGGVWCSGTGSGDFVRLRNHTLPSTDAIFSSVSQRILY